MRDKNQFNFTSVWPSYNESFAWY